MQIHININLKNFSLSLELQISEGFFVLFCFLSELSTSFFISNMTMIHLLCSSSGHSQWHVKHIKLSREISPAGAL